MASDSWRYPLTLHPDYMGAGSPVQQYQQRRADLVTGSDSPATAKLPEAPTNRPAATAVAVRAADQGVIGQGSDYGGSSTPQVKSGPVSGGEPNAGVMYPRFDGGNASILDRAPAFNAPQPYHAGQMFVTGQQSVGGGDGGRSAGTGLFSPQVDARLRDMDEQIDKYTRPGGSMFDSWRARQLSKRRDQLSSQEAMRAQARIGAFNADTGLYNAQSGRLTANVSAQRAANEVPLALMKNSTDLYGIETQAGTTQRGQTIGALTAEMQDRTRNRGIDVEAATAQRGQEYGVLTQLPKVVQGEMMRDAQARGDMEGVEQAAQLGNTPRAVEPTRVTPTGMGGYVISGPRGHQAFGANGLPILSPAQKATDPNAPDLLKGARGR